jgi:hypothetical protein
LTSGTKGAQAGADIADQDLGLFQGREVPALVGLAVVDQIAVGVFDSACSRLRRPRRPARRTWSCRPVRHRRPTDELAVVVAAVRRDHAGAALLGASQCVMTSLVTAAQLRSAAAAVITLPTEAVLQSAIQVAAYVHRIGCPPPG